MTGDMTRMLLSAVLAAFLAPATLLAQDTTAPQGRYAFTQDYEPSPAIWELSDEDTTIYLLGTIHVLPRGFRWRSERLNAIIEQADELVVESSGYDPTSQTVDAFGKVEQRIARRTPTSQRLSAQARPLWRALVERSNLDFEVIDSLPVLSALLTMGMSGDGTTPSSPLYGVETVLEGEFVRMDRPIVSIEDNGEVMYSLLRLDNDELIADLETKLLAWRGKSVSEFYNDPYEHAVGDAYWTQEHAWAQGIVQEDFNLGFGDGAIGRTIDTLLLDRRNSEWAEWLEDRLDARGTVLVAVGSGHFEGEVSLLVKLRERGLTPRRID